MKKTIFLLVLFIVLTLFIAGCSTAIKEPPAISVSIDNKEIEHISAKNKWNGSVYDREDTFVTILKEQKDIPIFKNGSIAEITFKSNPPDKFTVLDILIDESGRQIYTDKEIKNIPVVLYGGKYAFEIEKHFASSLSSYYEPEKKDIRGFRMIASWGENECEYAFIIKTYEEEGSEYLTGEIITGGDYEISSSGIGSFSFVPDKESREIIEQKYGSYDLNYLDDESYFLYYDDISVTESLPDKLGIYKVRVKFDLKNIYNYDRFHINDIQLTDNIGTILYEGKTYETNNLDLDVKVKDRVLGLIVDSVDKLGDEGLRVTFCGEIETEGYYNIFYGQLHERNLGIIYYDDNYVSNVPMMMGESSNKQLFYFDSEEELFSQLEDYSSFGRGKFKISNFHIVYNYGMGREPSEILTEIVSLDEGYKNMFESIDKADTSLIGYNDNFAIVSNTAEYDENNFAKSFNYYYINKNNPQKVHLLTTEDYYSLDEVISETEFSLITEGYNETTGSYGVLNRIECKITDNGVEISEQSTAKEAIMLNETEFYSLFEKASEAWGWFYVWTMPLKVDADLSLVEIETESGICFEVDYDGIETLEDLENYLKTIFSDEKVEGMLKSGRYFDVDGKLCAIDLARGTNHSYGKIVEVNKNIINENQIEYIVSVEKLDYNYELEGYEEFTFVTEKNGDFRVFSEFPAWW